RCIHHPGRAVVDQLPRGHQLLARRRPRVPLRRRAHRHRVARPAPRDLRARPDVPGPLARGQRGLIGCGRWSRTSTRSAGASPATASARRSPGSSATCPRPSCGARFRTGRRSSTAPCRTRGPPGTQVLDWTAPNEWNIRDAYVARPDGTRVIDFGESNLHVVSYSAPIRERMSLAALRPHLHTLPELPDWIPYRTSY